jgi:hypothetical protein
MVHRRKAKKEKKEGEALKFLKTHTQQEMRKEERKDWGKII